MERIRLERSELLSLLDLKSMDKVIGLDEEQLPMPESFDLPIILDDGRSRLLEQQLLSVAEDHYEIDSPLDGMLAVMADPQTVLRCWRVTPDREEEVWCCYYISGSTSIQLVTAGPEQFEIGRLDDVDNALIQIGEIFPLDPMPESVRYQAIIDQEDADLIQILADDRDEVPALSIIEADGLAPVEAISFYNDLTEPKWHGRIDFMACSAGEVQIYHRLMVLQGQENSWIVWQADPDKSDLHVQAASPGAFEEQLVAYWSELGS